MNLHQADDEFKQRVRELLTLNRITQTLAVVTDLQAALTAAAEIITYLFDADEIDISLLNTSRTESEITTTYLRRPDDVAGQRDDRVIPLAGDIFTRPILEQESPLILTLSAPDPRAEFLRQWMQSRRLYCLMAVGLRARGDIIGTIIIAAGRPERIFTPAEGHLAETVAGQIAGVIEVLRLFEREQRQRQLAERRRGIAESLGDILAILNANQPLIDILAYIARQANQLLESDANIIYTRAGPDEPFTVLAGEERGGPVPLDLPQGRAALVEAAATRRPVVVNIEPPRAEDGEKVAGPYRALLAVPLVTKGDVSDGLILYFNQAQVLSDETLELAVTFSHQVALALENGRLRDQVRQIAVADERTRLARDLHDAVTQTLFSASLIATALPQLWERQPHEARSSLEKLQQLTRGALAEMRTLLLELRPNTLVESKLSALLKHLGDATTGRTRIPVSLQVEGDSRLPGDVQVALYRIAQEALNNVCKHAEATGVVVGLHYWPERVMLRIRDDGRGFEPGAIPPGHLGIGIMHERARAVGASLLIHSCPGQGTEITVSWPHSGGQDDRVIRYPRYDC